MKTEERVKQTKIGNMNSTKRKNERTNVPMNKPTNSKQNAIRRQQWNNRKHVWRAEDQLLFWDFCFLCSVPLFLFVVLSTKLTLSNIQTYTKTHANTNTRMNKSIDGMRFFRFSVEVVLLYEKNSTANAPHNISILKRILFLYLYWFPTLDLFRVRLTMLSTIRIDVGWLAGRMVLQYYGKMRFVT